MLPECVYASMLFISIVFMEMMKIILQNVRRYSYRFWFVSQSASLMLLHHLISFFFKFHFTIYFVLMNFAAFFKFVKKEFDAACLLASNGILHPVFLHS